MTRKLLSLISMAALSISLIIITATCKSGSETGGAPVGIQSIDELSQQELDALEKTTVLKSEDSPTGYVVTFRYKDPQATRVRVYGEWKFSDVSHASLKTSLNAMPEDWKNGYFTWTNGSWPTADLTLNKETGIWSYTIPLPCGTWNYCFYTGGNENAAVDDVAGAARTWDPSNPPFLYDYEAANMNRDETLSNIYVPYDKVKQSLSLDFSEEAPRSSEKGAVAYATVTYRDTIQSPFGIYLPFGYDSARTEPYPIMVLLHGGGGVESSWFNLGAAINILDNMIAEGRVEPMVVVTPNASDLGWNRPAILDLITHTILPYMESNYNVASEPARRAFMGLSMGGATTLYALFYNTSDFGYFMPLSALITSDFQPNYQAAGIKDVKICLGFGWYDFIISSYMEQTSGRKLMSKSLYDVMIDFADNGIPFTCDPIYSGHTWTTWRQNLTYMLGNVLWK
jgi:enterochelin esterase-like enzyme